MIRISIVVFLFFSLFGVAQHQDKVDFIHAEVTIGMIPQEKKVRGFVVYDFEVLADVDSIFLDAKNMEFNEILLDGKPSKFNNTKSIVSIKNNFIKGNKHIVSLTYECMPEQTVYFMESSYTFKIPGILAGPLGEWQRGYDEKSDLVDQIWTQGQGKYSSYWLPSFDAMEKVEFDLNIKTYKDFQVIANGNLIDKVIKGDFATWKYDMQKPMSSYLLAFAIGDYSKQELVSASGIPIENYYYPADSLKVEPTYRYTKEIFDFLEEEIGFPYPWQNYKQVPVRDFLYAGMENTTATIFSDTYVIDSTAFVDKNYVNVNAHELAHQWFGNLVTEKDGKHHWLHEGFATFYAYLTEQKIFGDDHFYWKLYDTALQLKEFSDKGEGEALMNPKASSLTFYEKGAWALVMLRELVGEEKFKNGIKNYLKKYRYKNVTITYFLNEMEKASGMDLATFKLDWLESKELPFDKIKSFLKNASESISIVFEMENEFQRIKSDDLDFENYWNRSESVHFKQYMIEQHHSILPEAVIHKAFESDTIPIRQALANSLYGISGTTAFSESLKPRYETLLGDESYLTNEIALIKLWSTFPENRSVYLNRTKGIIGLPNKNVRLLWLTLALVTPEYGVQEKTNYLEELIGYTASTYNPEVRQLAFQYLNNINAMNTDVFQQLIKATNHHSWQFRNFARRLLDEQLKNETSKGQIQNLAKELNTDDLRYLKTKLDLP